MIPPIVIMVGFFVITSHIGNHVAKAQKRWMGSTQDRLKVLVCCGILYCHTSHINAFSDISHVANHSNKTSCRRTNDAKVDRTGQDQRNRVSQDLLVSVCFLYFLSVPLRACFHSARLVIVGVLSSATINFAGIAALGTFVGLKSEDLYPETLFTILTVVVSVFMNLTSQP